MNNELRDVAKGTIVQPLQRTFHSRPMSDSVHRVKISRVLRGCDDLEPPIQPPGADEEEPSVLRSCFGLFLLWPKSMIRLGTAGAITPQTTAPPVVPATSGGKAPLPPSPSPPRGGSDDHVDDMHMAQDPAEDDEDWNDHFFSTQFGNEEDLAGCPTEKATITKRLFGSQETPPACAFTESADTTNRPFILSPDTLHRAAGAQIAVPARSPKGKKGRKRKSSSSSQPVASTTANPIRFRDGPPRPEGIMWRIHVAGEPMLPKNLRKLASSELQSVHDGMLMIERRLLSEKDPSHPVFVVKVPPGLGFVDNAPADLFFLRFDGIFNMFHLYPLHYTMVRLFSLSLAMQIIRENTPGIAIVDPYYMRDGCLGSPAERRIVASYLKRIFVANKTKEYILVPYFPE